MNRLNIEKLAAVAFFGLRAASDHRAGAIYSTDVARYFNFGISSSGSVIGIFDYQRGNYLSGNPTGNGWSVFDYSDSQYIVFNKSGRGFSVYDYNSSSYIAISFTNRSVSLYSYADGKYYNFSF